MTSQRNQVNVRLDDETQAVVLRVAKANRISKSEVCRLALTGELAKLDARKNKTLSEEERRFALERLGQIAEYISSIRSDSRAIGNNVNQIAKAAHMKKILVHPETDSMEKYSELLGGRLEIAAKELNALWQLLA